MRMITAPTDEPLTKDEARVYLRNPSVTVTTDAELIGFIKSARERAEHRLDGLKLMPQTWEAYLDNFSGYYTEYAGYTYAGIVLPYRPVQSITSIKYLDSASVEQTLATTVYGVDLTNESARIYIKSGQSWPDTVSGYHGGNAVTIRFVAGYLSADEVPETIKHWMKAFIEEADKNRGTSQERERFSSFAEGLLDSERVPGI